ncbi:MAG TPA: hypothetical protein VN366_05645 [Feifaniaceae bacterium]|nr:hypothetical protein [Feifaniaceae bacterium]
MEQAEMLQKIQKGDQEAFRALFQAYAEPTYRILFKKCGSKATARMLLKRVFQDVHAGLKLQEDADPTALWLKALANWQADTHLFCRNETEAVWQTMSAAQAAQMPDHPETAPRALPREPFTAPVPVKRKGATALIVILLTLTAALVWVLTGLLMEMQFLPQADLGYEWFNSTVFHLF